MEQKAWMIEKQIDGVPHWWMRRNGENGDDPNNILRWTTDPNKARRYESKAEAEWVIGKGYSDLIQIEDAIATEHIWMD